MSDAEPMNGTEPRRITVTFDEDGSPNYSAGDPVTSFDIAVAARMLELSTTLPAHEHSEAGRGIIIDFDRHGEPTIAIAKDTRWSDRERAMHWLKTLAHVMTTQNIMVQIRAQAAASIVAPNRKQRRRFGLA